MRECGQWPCIGMCWQSNACQLWSRLGSKSTVCFAKVHHHTTPHTTTQFSTAQHSKSSGQKMLNSIAPQQHARRCDQRWWCCWMPPCKNPQCLPSPWPASNLSTTHTQPRSSSRVGIQIYHVKRASWTGRSTFLGPHLCLVTRNMASWHLDLCPTEKYKP
jgi:hypothetical protein